MVVLIQNMWDDRTDGVCAVASLRFSSEMGIISCPGVTRNDSEVSVKLPTILFSADGPIVFHEFLDEHTDFHDEEGETLPALESYILGAYRYALEERRDQYPTSWGSMQKMLSNNPGMEKQWREAESPFPPRAKWAKNCMLGIINGLLHHCEATDIDKYGIIPPL